MTILSKYFVYDIIWWGEQGWLTWSWTESKALMKPMQATHYPPRAISILTFEPLGMAVEHAAASHPTVCASAVRLYW